MRKIALIVAAALAVAVPAAPAAAKDRSASKNIVETAVAAKKFKTLVSLVKTAGLAETLSGTSPYTVFAPTDAAFRKVPKSTLRSLGKDRAKLRRVLLYHVVAGRYRARRLIRAGSVSSLAGPALHVRVRRRGVRVAGAKVVTANVGASNGVIHAINRVLIPPTR